MTNPTKYLIRFGLPSNTDIEGLYIDAKTAISYPSSVPIMFDHGLCPVMEDREIGTATLNRVDDGIKITPSFTITDDFSMQAVRLFVEGHLGWSSGTSVNPDYELQGSVKYAKTWDILEASITPTPCEPWLVQNPVSPIKTKSFADKKASSPKQLPKVVVKGLRSEVPEAIQWYIIQLKRREQYNARYSK